VQLGVAFPHPEFGTDPVAIRDFAKGAEDAGIDYLSAIEHVAGAHAERFVGLNTGFAEPPYLHDSPFHEPLTLFAYLAGVTSRLEFVTGVLVLPQRQTVLVAKQAAEVALLSGGRLRLGVGVGWNQREFEALGEDFHNRGARQAEQITVLRKLWTEPLVTFRGDWHSLDRVAIAPLPAAPIEIWMGGGFGEATLRRVAMLADGWIPALRHDSDLGELIDRMHRYLEEAGREPSSLRIQTWIGATGSPDGPVAAAKRFELLGVTHLGLTGGPPLSGVPPMEQLERAIEVKRLLELELGH
jgi:probable F420-dependent oxidoreductase